MPSKDGLPRAQLVIYDEQAQTSMMFEDQRHFPRLGEYVTIYDADRDGAELLSGIVAEVRWSYSNENDDLTCTVNLRPVPTA